MLATTKPKRVLIALSGGVDSSVCVHLLKEQGYEVAGVVFDMSPAHTKTVNAAKDSARSLDIPLFVKNLHKEFNENVISYFVSEYLEGRTPNPCVVCNQYIKFPAFLQSAREYGYTYIATGHYARIECDGGVYRLRKGKQQSKDQSYVLYNLNPELLASAVFPLGEYGKEEVRALAAENGLVVANKADSQDICFVPDGDYCGFLERYTGESGVPGNFVDEAGNTLGTHRGIWQYTIGQRKGLGVSFGKPMFVSKINPEANTVTLCEDTELYSGDLYAGQMNYLDGELPQKPFEATVRIRYAHTGVAATVYPQEKNGAHIVFLEPQRAVTKGQSAVLYKGEYVLGGGTILG